MNENRDLTFDFTNAMAGETTPNMDSVQNKLRDALKKRISEIEERFNKITYDEEGNVIDERYSKISYDANGNLVGNLAESYYYSDAKKSADLFEYYMMKTEIEKLRKGTQDYKQKVEEDKVNLAEAKELLKEEKNKLKKVDEEILKIDIKVLSANDEDLARHKEELEEKRRARGERLAFISYFEKEIYQLTNSINNNNSNIKTNNDIVRVLNQEIKTIKAKKDIDYMNMEQLSRDMKELSELQAMLTHIDSYGKKGPKQEEKDTINKNEMPDKISNEMPNNKMSDTIPVEMPNNNLPVVNPGEELPKLPEVEPEKVENTDIIIKDESLPSIPVPTPEVVSDKDERVFDGFTLDFIEKYGYAPSYREKRLNPNYNGDTSRLVSGEQEAYFRDNSNEAERDRVRLIESEERNERIRLRRDQVAIRIRNAPRQLIDSVVNYVNRRFSERRERREQREAELNPIMK